MFNVAPINSGPINGTVAAAPPPVSSTLDVDAVLGHSMTLSFAKGILFENAVGFNAAFAADTMLGFDVPVGLSVDLLLNQKVSFPEITVVAGFGADLLLAGSFDAPVTLGLSCTQELARQVIVNANAALGVAATADLVSRMRADFDLDLGLFLEKYVGPALYLDARIGLSLEHEETLRKILALDAVFGVSAVERDSHIREVDFAATLAAEVAAELSYGMDVAQVLGLTIAMESQRRVLEAYDLLLGLSAVHAPSVVLSMDAEANLGLSADATINQRIGMALDAGLALTVRIRMEGAEEFQMFVVNSETTGVSTYSGLRFTSLCSFKGQVYGTDEGGIKLLSGNDDNGESIRTLLRTRNIEVNEGVKANIYDAYIGVANDGELYFRTTTDDGVERTYKTAARPKAVTSAAQYPVERRIQLAQGVRSVYYTFELETVDGKHIEYDTIRWSIAELSRRIN